MRKTLLLVFIHGFKGGDDTFGDFPNHLKQLVQHALPKINVESRVYPRFETRGELAECVSRFKDWLLEKVIDIEVSAHTPSPTVDPSVRCILIGHSMGGIVAADTLLSITSDQPLDSSSSLDESSVLNTLMFPYIQGVLAFDTPYLGISPGVVAHSGETHYKTATTAWTQLGGLAGSLWGGQTAGNAQFKAAEAAKKPVAALPAPPTNEELKAASPWERWSKVALYAGAATAVAAAGSAAYYKRDTITESFGFIGSHLAFINCLMRPEELKKRVARIVKVNRELSVGWANLYTRLGQKAQNKDGSSVGKVLGGLRTFCNLPVKGGEVERGGYWREAVNDGATDETWAHMSMFLPKDNPGYFKLAEDARGLVVQWVDRGWHESSSPEGQQAIEMEL